MAKTHGETVGNKPSREYKSWSGAKRRCGNPKEPGYKNYGGRGITMCERWTHSYEAFLEDMGRCPKGMLLDRIDNERGYEKGNCRWTTWKEQIKNRRNSIYVEYKGKRRYLKDVADELGMTHHALYKRVWECPHRSFEDVIKRIKAGKRRVRRGLVGVYQDKRTGMWRAQRMVGGVRRYKGEFWTAEEAAEAYEELGGAMP